MPHCTPSGYATDIEVIWTDLTSKWNIEKSFLLDSFTLLNFRTRLETESSEWTCTWRSPPSASPSPHVPAPSSAWTSTRGSRRIHMPSTWLFWGRLFQKEIILLKPYRLAYMPMDKSTLAVPEKMSVLSGSSCNFNLIKPYLTKDNNPWPNLGGGYVNISQPGVT